MQSTIREMKTFLFIWAGQLVSLTGSQLTAFALGVWVYQQNGSATQFALISAATILPNVLLAPLAGALVDRWDRRRTMIVGNIGAACSTLVMALLLFGGRLEVWQIYIGVSVGASFGLIQGLAYMASTALLVPKVHLGRANGLVQTAFAVAMLVAPMLAGFLVVTIGVPGVMLIDGLTFSLALVSLLLVRIPTPPASESASEQKPSLRTEIRDGWQYLRARPGLLALTIFFAASNFLIGFIEVLFTPMVLSTFSADVLGVMLSLGGVGMLIGSVAMSVWGGPKRRIHGVLGFSALLGLAAMLASLKPIIWVMGLGVLLAFLSVPIFQGTAQVILQSKVDLKMQGRIFSLRQMISLSMLPLAYGTAGPLADYVFEPLMAEGGALASSVGLLIGTGPGRGIALIFIIMGSLTVLLSGLGYLYAPLRRVELDLPDAFEDADTETPAQSAEKRVALSPEVAVG